MRITIDSTDKLVTLVINGRDVPARVWQGHTVNGDGVEVPVQAFITRISPEVYGTDPRAPELIAAFERDLRETAKPRPTVEAIPLRMII